VLPPLLCLCVSAHYLCLTLLHEQADLRTKRLVTTLVLARELASTMVIVMTRREEIIIPADSASKVLQVVNTLRAISVITTVTTSAP
jgi:hypothetical protein